MGIVNLRLDGEESDVRAAVALLEEAPGERLHISAPVASRHPRYAGSWLARGTLRTETRPEPLYGAGQQVLTPDGSPGVVVQVKPTGRAADPWFYVVRTGSVPLAFESFELREAPPAEQAEKAGRLARLARLGKRPEVGADDVDRHEEHKRLRELKEGNDEG